MTRSILIVDDDEDIRNVLQSYLERGGFKVVLAANADEAKMRFSFQPFDILLLDMQLPGQNGLQFLSRLKQHPPRTWPKIVIMSGMEIGEEARMKMMTVLGVDKVMQKPLVPSDLMDVLKNQLFKQPEKRSYDASIINAFLTGTINAIQGNAGKAPDREGPFVKENAMTYGEFTGVIQFHGSKTRGVVALSFERSCVEALARAVFQNPNLDINDTLLVDFAGELCNQSAGQTQAIFEKGGNRFEISTPTLIQGKDHRIIHKMNAPCLVLPFRWGAGKFFTEFVLENVVEAKKEEKEIDTQEEKEAVSPSGEVTFL